MDTGTNLNDESIKIELTSRELEILRLLVKGYRNQQIAAELHISEACVRFHLKEIYSRTGIDSRTALVAWAIQKVFVDK